jgi:hypothetical protein
VHISESCDNTPEASAVAAAHGRGERLPPNLITGVTTTDATVPDTQATDTIHQALAPRTAPGRALPRFRLPLG